MSKNYLVMLRESERYTREEAAGDYDAPGAKLRMLSAMIFVEDQEVFDQMYQLAKARGMWPSRDRCCMGKGTFCSPESLSKAVGTSVPHALYLLRELCDFADMAGVLGFSWQNHFPEVHLCTLH